VRILIHSNGPMVPTGYGRQVKLFLPKLKELGHEVAVSAFYGVSGSPITYDGTTIFPAGMHPYGGDVLVQHAMHYRADVVITLMDLWKLADSDLTGIRVAAWLPNDCQPLGRPDQRALDNLGAFPIAMSRFGRDNLREAGYPDTAYVPHAVDTSVFRPQPDRDAFRAELGIADRFVIGICSANRDAIRKSWPEQFRAFAKFRNHHDDALLLVHATVTSPQGLNLAELAYDMGIASDVMFSDQYAQVAGIMPDEMMAGWFGTLDVLSQCSAAEAFGIPSIEAQATGTPVIVTKGSAQTELCGSGWLVSGQEFWNPIHRAWWVRPNVDSIVRSYEKAYNDSDQKRAMRREDARTFALAYDVDRVTQENWVPTIAKLAELMKAGESDGPEAAAPEA
jgi:glycosyltransferase involved in cell wall biosynthesis